MTWPLIPVLARALRRNDGGVAITFALALPALAMAAAWAVQYASLVQQKANLQEAADSAALGGAKNLQLGNASASQTQAVAVAIANAAVGPDQTNWTHKVAATVVDNNTGVSVDVSRSMQSIFGKLFGTDTLTVGAHAIAHMAGSTTPICVVGLNTSAKGTISLDTNAVVQAPGCAAYSNSRHPWAISSVANAVLKTSLTCAVGGKQGSFPNFSPQPKSGCPVLVDPLRSRPAPSVKSCDKVNLSVTRSMSLDPGVYCGGLTVSGSYSVTLNPGLYIMKDGPLKVSGGGSVSGQNVGFYLSGTGAVLNFDVDSTINLTAPKDGIMAGILFFEDRANAGGARHQILSSHAESLLGTIYLPKGNFFVGSNAPVAANSAYTVVVADKVELSAGPTLVLNSNYGATDIPVPDGVGPHSGTLSLTQ